MPSYPWKPGDELDAVPLNAAIGAAQATANTALTTAQAAQAAATAARPLAATLQFPGPVTPGTYLFTGTAPYPFTILSIDASVGSNGGSITATVRNAGVAVTALTGIVITAATKTNFSASGTGTAVIAGATVDVVLTITGAPTGAFIVLNGVH